MSTRLDNWKHKTIRFVANILGVNPVDSWRATGYGKDIDLLEKALDHNIEVDVISKVSEDWDGTNQQLILAFAHFNDVDPARVFPELDEGQLETLRDYIELEMNAEEFAGNRGVDGVRPAVRLNTYEDVLELLDEVKEEWDE
jgi:hypothetical protein